MNGKPQEARKDEQEDILEQIIAQGLDKRKTSAQTAAAEKSSEGETPPSPRQEDSGAAAPPANKKNRRSAVYLYLLILFGAAFFMLLLAYFIQQRSNESTISDLKDSMNLSRQELLDEIRALEEENEGLTGIIDRMSGDLIQWQERYEEKEQEVTDLRNQYYDRQEELYYSWTSFWELEQFYQAGDYESCAAVLILQRQSQIPYYTPKVALERYEEIVRAVIDAGILEEDYYNYPDNYNDLLDAYFAEHPVLSGEEGNHSPTGQSNIIYDYDVISRFT